MKITLLLILAILASASIFAQTKTKAVYATKEGADKNYAKAKH
jgi:hypothetical protein